MLEKIKNLRPLKRAAAILLLISTLVCVIDAFSMMSRMKAYPNAFFSMIVYIIFAAASVSIFYGLVEEGKEPFVLYGYAGVAVGTVIQFFYYWTNDVFTKYSYSYSYYSGGSSSIKFSFGGFLVGLLAVAGVLAMLALAYINSEKKIEALNNLEEKITPVLEQYWYMPFSIFAFTEVCAIISIVGRMFSSTYWMGAISYATLDRELFLAVFVLMTLAWKHKDGLVITKKKKEKVVIETSGKFSAEAYCGIVRFLLLSAFTFGIWPLIWIYRMTKELNKVEGFEYRDPCKKLLLLLFVPFYSMYWMYQSALRVEKAANDEEILSDIAMLCLVLSMVFPMGAALLMQDKMNKMILKY